MQSSSLSPINNLFGLCSGILIACVLILAGCTETNGASNMDIEDFYSDPQMISLIKAAEKNDTQMLTELVKAGVDPNTFGNEHMTPLMWVLGHKNKKAMRVLLAAGADPNLRDPDGFSPMAMAAGAKDTELMKILLEGGGDPNVNNRFGKPVLFVAISQMRTENVKMLLEYGAEINATDKSGTTPVMYAATLNQYHIVHFLLEKGADPYHRTRGDMSLAWIVQNNEVNPQFEAYEIREQVIKMLKERGVQYPEPR
jgi:uncharacterized protein